MDIDCSKTGDDKLKFQAPWDFDIPFGIVRSYEAYYYANNLYVANSHNPWLFLLYKSIKLKKKSKKNNWAWMKIKF